MYSTVCRSWQEFFEKIIFHRLVISQDDVDRCASLTARHISLVRPLLGEALARLENLRSLSASYSVDATDFFSAFISDLDDRRPWDKLSSLSLTPQLLSSTSSRDDMKTLLLPQPPQHDVCLT